MIDVGMIWATGFPADKGGPMKWADLRDSVGNCLDKTFTRHTERNKAPDRRRSGFAQRNPLKRIRTNLAKSRGIESFHPVMTVASTALNPSAAAISGLMLFP